MADMIKFYKGLVGNLPETGANGALYITTDEGAIYLGTGTGMKRLGDFVQVDAVANLPEKAHEGCLYYCVAENILAKWNGTEWKQINKQPTAEEMKTLLGLGSLAYLSEVAEANLNADLAAKINAASGAQHSHDNKTVLDGITAEKVAAWDSAEADAIAHADGLNTAMNTRVEALEAIDHEHANKALLDTYTQTEADLADAVAKKHAHANADELAKIADGDKAKWDAVAADHLTAADKTTLEDAIKEAKKAGTDANTNIETYKVANDARVLAVEEDVAEITNTENGILAQAKSYSDGKLATAKTEISAEIDADVKVVNDAFEAYKTSNDAALAGVKATAEAAAVKTEVEAELAKKVAKIDYEADKATFATKTEVEAVDAKFADYKTAEAQKAIDDAQDAEIAKKVDKVEGKDLIATSEIERLKDVKNYDDTALAGRVTTAEGKITALEGAVDTKADADHVHDASEITFNYDYMDSAENVQDAIIELRNLIDIANETQGAGYEELVAANEAQDQVIATKLDEAAGKALIASETATLKSDVETIKGDYLKAADKTELEGKITAITDDYLKAADKTELEGKITAEETRAKGVEEGLQNQINLIMNNPDTKDVIDSISEFTQYIEDHGEIAEGFRTDIDANAKAIEDEAARADAAEKLLAGRIDALEEIDHDAYVGADAALKAELQAEIDADVKAASDTLTAAIEAAKTEAANQDAVVLAEAQAYADQAEADAIAAAEGKVNALAGNVYTKEEVYTKTEVENLLTWGSF